MLRVENLSTGYGQSQVLFDVSLAIAPGEVVALLGRNGMGKTTTVAAITGMLPVWGGTVLFDGSAVANLPSFRIARLGLGLVPEGRQIFPTLTVQENLIATSRAGDWTLDRIWGLFPRLREKARRRAGSLSGGEQQMVAIGRALMSHPRMLLMDEPSVGLSPALVGDMIEAIRALRARGLTVLLVEQNVGVAAAVADDANVLQGGCITYSGPAAGLLDNEEVLRSYLG